MTLLAFFKENPKAALGFSGGVDSSYLLYAGVQAGADIHPYYIKTAFQPQFELDDAERLCAQLGIPLTVLELDVLAKTRPSRQIPADRCYHCKTAPLRRAFHAGAGRRLYAFCWMAQTPPTTQATAPVCGRCRSCMCVHHCGSAV